RAARLYRNILVSVERCDEEARARRRIANLHGRRRSIVERSDFEPRRGVEDEAEVVSALALKAVSDDEAAQRAFERDGAAVCDRPGGETRVTVMLRDGRVSLVARREVEHARPCFIAELKRRALVRRVLLDAVNLYGRMV